jgi:hypothetical protein
MPGQHAGIQASTSSCWLKPEGTRWILPTGWSFRYSRPCQSPRWLACRVRDFSRHLSRQGSFGTGRVSRPGPLPTGIAKFCWPCMFCWSRKELQWQQHCHSLRPGNLKNFSSVHLCFIVNTKRFTPLHLPVKRKVRFLGHFLTQVQLLLLAPKFVFGNP